MNQPEREGQKEYLDLVLTRGNAAWNRYRNIEGLSGHAIIWTELTGYNPGSRVAQKLLGME